jgi:Outer membrane protein Omp28/Secretion system C-terminal sorting domain
MKKLVLLVFALTVIYSNVSALYIWQDFDNPSFPPRGWTISTTNPFNWDWSIRASGYGSGYGSARANFNDALAGLTFDLMTPVFTASGAGDSLGFDHAYTCYTTENDQLKIWYSINGGTSWTELITLNGGASGPLKTAPVTAIPFVPLSSQWATKKYALPTGTNMIKFTAISAIGNNLFLDNIKIGNPYSNDVGATGFKRYVRTYTTGNIDTPKVYVRNFGSTTQSFNVALTISPGTYNNTQAVTSLAPGQMVLVNFPQWTAGTAGAYTFKAISGLAGDQNTSNDTVINTYYVSSNPRNVAIEYCTGTWCQWCPCGETAMHELEVYYPNTVFLAYHGGSTSEPYYNFNGNNIISLLGMNAYPTGTCDRLIYSNAYFGASGFVEYPFMRYMNSPEAPVKIGIVNQSFNASTGLLNVNLNMTALANLTGQFKINYVITEDNLVYPQTGNTYCAGSSTFVHNWVVRNMVNNAAGENLNSGGTWTNGQVINKSFSTTLPSTWISSNCKLKIFVYKDGSPLYLAEVQQAIQTPITATGVNNEETIPTKFELGQNYPNPFNPVTNVKFSIPKDGHASLRIYDITGKLVATYLDEYVKAGHYNAEFDGSELSSGTYFYTLKSENFMETKKMILLK